MAPIIRVENLVKRYGQRMAIDNVSFTLEAGAIFGFIGPNGAGKTTTIRIMTTLLEPSSGQVFVDDHPVSQNPYEVRRILGYMPDYFGTYNDMTVWEYLDFFSACYEIPAAQRSGLIRDLLELVELSHRRYDFVNALSRGMKQRLCLARCLVHDPKLLILDEPASGLDPRARVEFRDLLVELKNMGKTILLSSHILADLAEICTEIGIIENGKMVTHGNIEIIKHHMQSSRYLAIRVLGPDLDQARAVLTQIEAVGQLEHQLSAEGDGELLVQFNGDKAAASQLLRQLVIADVPVLGFSETSDSLEDVFMKLTEGIVS